MPSRTYHLMTDKPPEAVFDALADLRTAPEWMPLVSGVEHVEGPQPLAAGTTYRIASDRYRITYRALEVQRPALVVWHTSSPGRMEGTDRWAFRPTSDGGTEVDYTTSFDYEGITKLGTPFGALALKAISGRFERAMAERVDAAAD